MNLKGKVAIVTGGTRDIGKAISLKLAKEGAKVVVNYNSNEANAQSTLNEIKQAGGEAILFKADVTKKAEVEAMIAASLDALTVISYTNP